MSTLDTSLATPSTVPMQRQADHNSVARGQAPIHPTYLRFTPAQLAEHLAPVRGGGSVTGFVEHYVQRAEKALQHAHETSSAVGECTPHNHQIEKDERFWVASALLTAHHSPDRVDALARLLTEALGARPPFPGFPSWRQALGDADDLRLYFEVNLPAPQAYKEAVRPLGGKQALIPWLEGIAAGPRAGLEGPTKADAMLIAPGTGVAVVFEAKVLSDASTHTTYDATRNQLARNLDVLLEANERLLHPLSARVPERTCFVLVTPEVFLKNPTTRFYGWLMDGYRRGPRLLKEHLPHRSVDQLEPLSNRLGWISWEDCHRLVPGACPWLSASS